MGAVDPYDLVSRLLNATTPDKGITKTIKEDELLSLCDQAKQVFQGQASCLELNAPVRICGDIHGQYSDLLRLFYKGGFPPSANYLFLGDYVDRGKQNLEVITLMFSLKVLFPKNFHLLRGNHELANINRVYGFFEECNRRYSSTKLYEAFQDTFNYMPFTAVKNSRGAAYGFGGDAVQAKCTKLGVDLIARAHQVVQDGYEFFGNRRLVTIFSAPHYCGQFDNAAAMMVVDESLKCSFEILRPTIGKAGIKMIPTSQ
ncbi:unnamed protein product, partial [Mesorhabditis spiculigera]